MAKKFYVVKQGRNPGIYDNWADCKAQVDGFSGAVYKGFATSKEAQQFLIQKDVPDKLQTDKKVPWNREPSRQTEDNAVSIYVDGSYNKKNQEFSYGMVVLADGQEYTFSQKFADSELAQMHNVAGEIKGAEAAMQYAIEHGYAKVTIYHDYEGIAKWCLGEWRANKEGTRAYQAFYEQACQQVEISFVKVTGHSNDTYNDLADELAKKALGLRQ